MKTLIRDKINREDILGHFAEPEDFDLLIEEDCDLYDRKALDSDQKTEENIIFKFRKGVFSEKEQDLAYKGLRDAATQSQNRGVAAGPRVETCLGRDWVTHYQQEVIDYFLYPSRLFRDFPVKHADDDVLRGQVWLRSKVIAEKYGDYDGWFDRWAQKIKNETKENQIREALEVRNLISDTNYATPVLSGIAGYFDRYPRIPYGRACGYNEHHPEKFELCFPYLRKLNKIFKKELPSRWKAQNACAKRLDKRFLIDETVFTTLTINYNWRTAGHRDAGDLSSGFSNISGIGKGWKGCIFTLPEWRVGINLQPGDLLLVNNHEGIHSNTEFEGDDNDRVSIVAYFREKMLELGSWEYEQLRYQFVEERRLNKAHQFWRPLWNGISPGMWKSKEWGEYLSAHGMYDEDGLIKEQNSLEAFF